MLKQERQKYNALLDDYDELKIEFSAISKKVVKIRNERGAGRKPISEELKRQVIEMRNNGATYRQIADTLNLAAATVYKAANPIKRNGRAGRKPITEELKRQVIELRRNGATYQQIANGLGLSIGTVHKTVNAPASTAPEAYEALVACKPSNQIKLDKCSSG